MEVSSPLHPEQLNFMQTEDLKAMAIQDRAASAAVQNAIASTFKVAEAELNAHGDVVSFKVPSLSHMQHFRDLVSDHADFVYVQNLNGPNHKQSQHKHSDRFTPNSRNFYDEHEFNTKNPFTSAQVSGSPGHVKSAYKIDKTLKGGNSKNVQMVWGTGTFGYKPDDLSMYWNNQGVDNDLKQVSLYDPTNNPQGGKNFVEGTLDVESITGIATHITTYVANTDTSADTESSDGFGDALLHFLSDFRAKWDSNRDAMPKVISMSLGSLSQSACDTLCRNVVNKNSSISQEDCSAFLRKQFQVCMFKTGTMERINQEFMKLGLMGVTVTAASGDGGSHFAFGKYNGGILGDALNQESCNQSQPVFPADSPQVLSVGGSSWDPDEQYMCGANSDNPVGWNRGGTGFSIMSQMPDQQTQIVSDFLSKNKMDLTKFNSKGRAYPDVVAVANQVPVCDQGGCSASGGTSASAPIVAGMISLLNEQRLNKGLKQLGFINPRLQQVGQQHQAEMFKDITLGNSNFQCDQGFQNTVGFDIQSGFGEINFEGWMKYMTNDD